MLTRLSYPYRAERHLFSVGVSASLLRAEDARRLDPRNRGLVDAGLDVRVDADRPCLALYERRTCPPDVRDSVAHNPTRSSTLQEDTAGDAFESGKQVAQDAAVGASEQGRELVSSTQERATASASS